MLSIRNKPKFSRRLLSQTALARWRFSAHGSCGSAPGRASGRGFFHIVETATGKVRGFRRSHNEACSYAEQLKRQQAGK
ncbi:Uncharacterised protein [Pseudomonas aeruginosa]|nr:Uncharacterised protein [Pseudomonas aeruginosa]